MSGKHIVIIGAGFGGLYAAKELANKDADVTLVDKRNFHLFQPLLYQVATGGLSPADISSPIRSIFNRQDNIRVIWGRMESMNHEQKYVIVSGKHITYDILILATGAHHHYFGNDNWSEIAPGLKTVEDALKIRQKIMRAFEEAEYETNREKRCEWQRFIIVGGGPTGVELAGALAELANQTLLGDFRKINPKETEIFLVEGLDRILTTFPESLASKAEKSLKNLGVTVKTGSMVTRIDGTKVEIKKKDASEIIRARTILWAAGVQASDISQLVVEKTAAKTDKAGKIIVNQDLTIPGFKDIFVIGDLAHFTTENGLALPGVAQVAMQQGRYVAHKILGKNKSAKPFHYLDKGNLAVIGRKSAVADIRKLKLSGWPAWFIWIFVHIAYLIEYDNKMKVMLEWAWNFFTRKRGARLITNIGE